MPQDQNNFFPEKLIGLGKQYTTSTRLPSNHTASGTIIAIQRDATNGRFGLVLDLLFCGRCTVPVSQYKSALFLQDFLELFVAVHAGSVFASMIHRLFVEFGLNIL